MFVAIMYVINEQVEDHQDVLECWTKYIECWYKFYRFRLKESPGVLQDTLQEVEMGREWSNSFSNLGSFRGEGMGSRS